MGKDIAYKQPKLRTVSISLMLVGSFARVSKDRFSHSGVNTWFEDLLHVYYVGIDNHFFELW